MARERPARRQGGSRAPPGLGPCRRSPRLHGQGAQGWAPERGQGQTPPGARIALLRPTRPREWIGLSDHTKGPQPGAGLRPGNARTRGSLRGTGPGTAHSDRHKPGWAGASRDPRWAGPGARRLWGAGRRSWERAEAPGSVPQTAAVGQRVPTGHQERRGQCRPRASTGSRPECSGERCGEGQCGGRGTAGPPLCEGTIPPQPPNRRGPSSGGRGQGGGPAGTTWKPTGAQAVGSDAGEEGRGIGLSPSVSGDPAGRARTPRSSPRAGPRPHTWLCWHPDHPGQGQHPLPRPEGTPRLTHLSEGGRVRASKGLPGRALEKDLAPPGPGRVGAAGLAGERAGRRAGCVARSPPPLGTLGRGSPILARIKNRLSTEPGLGFSNSMTVSSWPCLGQRSQRPR